jgi:hypothetical protein
LQLIILSNNPVIEPFVLKSENIFLGLIYLFSNNLENIPSNKLIFSP